MPPKSRETRLQKRSNNLYPKYASSKAQAGRIQRAEAAKQQTQQWVLVDADIYPSQDTKSTPGQRRPPKLWKMLRIRSFNAGLTNLAKSTAQLLKNIFCSSLSTTLTVRLSSKIRLMVELLPNTVMNNYTQSVWRHTLSYYQNTWCLWRRIFVPICHV